MSTERGNTITIEKHLNQYGLFKFDSFNAIEEYAYSNFPKPSEEEIELLNNRRFADPSGSLHDNLKFYNGVGSSNVLRSIILSEKFGSYVKCSQTILDALKNPKKILDVGCNIGYLTTWFAQNFCKANVYGIDNSIDSIDFATKMKNKMNINNVHFQVMDFNNMNFSSKSFDVVLDTQSIYYSTRPSKVFNLIQKLIIDDGLIITVPGFGELNKIRKYLNDIRQAGLIIRSIDFIEVNDLGNIGHYPFIVADLQSKPAKLHLEEKFNRIA